jgi:hypothetical protein
VRDRRTVLGERDVEDRLGDHGPRERRSQGVALIGGVRADRVETGRGERLTRVDHVMFEVERGRGRLGLGELVVGLADVDGNADHLVEAVLLLQERDADGGIEPAGEGERDAIGGLRCGVGWGCHGVVLGVVARFAQRNPPGGRLRSETSRRNGFVRA